MRLMETLEINKISERDFGFMRGRSTEDAIVEMRKKIAEFEGRYAIALLFDI